MTARPARVVALVSALLAALALPAAAEVPLAERCPAPADALIAADRLPYVARALRAGKPVRLLVVGTASSGGAGVSDPAKAFPAVLLEALRRGFPGREFSLAVSSRRGAVARQMADGFDQLIAREMPTLAIWQTGTADAVHGASVEGFDEALTDGVGNFHAHGADVVLMNMQYSPQSTLMIDFEPYLAAMEQAAQSEEVNLFRRFELMRHWVEAELVSFPDRPARADPKVADYVHGCIGALLAEMIQAAVRETP